MRVPNKLNVPSLQGGVGPHGYVPAKVEEWLQKFFEEEEEKD